VGLQSTVSIRAVEKRGKLKQTKGSASRSRKVYAHPDAPVAKRSMEFELILGSSLAAAYKVTLPIRGRNVPPAYLAVIHKVTRYHDQHAKTIRAGYIQSLVCLEPSSRNGSPIISCSNAPPESQGHL
jgi:hypothetical protein